MTHRGFSGTSPWTGGLSCTSPWAVQGSHEPLLELGGSHGPLLGLGGSHGYVLELGGNMVVRFITCSPPYSYSPSLLGPQGPGSLQF